MSIYGISKDRLALGEIKRGVMKTQDKKRRLLKKYNIENEENLDQVIEQLKQKASEKTQQFYRFRKRKTIIIKIKCLEQTVRNFTIFLDRKIPM